MTAHDADLQRYCELIIGAMRAHDTSAAVQQAGLRAMFGAASSCQGLLALGAGEVFARALLSHAGHAGVLDEGILVLAAITRDRATHGPMGAAGACEALVQALSERLSADVDAKVVAGGLWAIYHLAADDANRGRLSVAGAEELVLGIMQHYLEDGFVQGAGQQAATRLIQ
ncbi:hypothetical protein JKP88DRAFT_178405 [Tribonema minus]|uniref:Uncharacterized protein n=1 Tax=Tribonema minus TaxID=303371 RepID=A0A835Z6T9_9STRA|nr:hypothetical protein JKP88DRAFT_178405 [Tribonema minus]